MKKIIVAILIIGLAGIAYAENTGYRLLNDARATGPGPAKDVKQAYCNWGCDIITFTNMSGAVVRIEGNQGGAGFDPAGMGIHTMTSAQLTARTGSFAIINHCVKKIRANTISLSGGVDPKVNVQCTGRD